MTPVEFQRRVLKALEKRHALLKHDAQRLMATNSGAVFRAYHAVQHPDAVADLLMELRR